MEIKLNVFSAEKGLEQAALTAEAGKEPFLQLVAPGFDSGKITGEKLFYCLLVLHQKLDAAGLKLLCIGCRYDVYPSGMALSMGQGTTAYKMILGQPATELVNIFDPTDDVGAIWPLAEKKAFHTKWFESLRIR